MGTRGAQIVRDRGGHFVTDDSERALGPVLHVKPRTINFPGMTSAVDRVRGCIERADAESDAMAIAYLARRDQQALTEAAAVDSSLPLAGQVLAVKACF